MECHLYLHPCDLPAQWAFIDQPEPTMNYPTTVEEILQTQTMRYEQLEDIYQPTPEMKRHRVPNCERLRELVEVSRYSVIKGMHINQL